MPIVGTSNTSRHIEANCRSSSVRGATPSTVLPLAAPSKISILLTIESNSPASKRCLSCDR